MTTAYEKGINACKAGYDRAIGVRVDPEDKEEWYSGWDSEFKADNFVEGEIWTEEEVRIADKVDGFTERFKSFTPGSRPGGEVTW